MRGFSLLETVIYVALLAIVLPMTMMFFLRTWAHVDRLDPRLEIEQTAGSLFSLLSFEVSSAQQIHSGSSRFADDAGKIELVDDEAQVLTIESVQDTIDFSGTLQNVQRVRLVRGAGAPVWLTDRKIDVERFRFDPIRDSGGLLTGLRLDVSFTQINKDADAFRKSSFEQTTALWLSPHTIEN